MISKNKARVIVSLDKDVVAILDNVVKWYNDCSRVKPANRSVVINDIISEFSSRVGVK